MSECSLLAALAVLKRRMDLDWPKERRRAVQGRVLKWKEYFSLELAGLEAENRTRDTVRYDYEDTLYDFITFTRNQLVHHRDLEKAFRRITAFGDPLDTVIQTLERSPSHQVLPVLRAVRMLSRRLWHLRHMSKTLNTL
jgi:hypothetical protein